MKYKNISKQFLFVPGVGAVEPGEMLESEKELNNPNLELVVKKPVKTFKKTKSKRTK